MKLLKLCSLLLAGSFFLGGCWGGRVKSGVTVNGVDVGGLSYEEAEARVRDTLEYLPLRLETPAGELACPIDYRDDVAAQLRTAKRGQSCTAHVFREWACMEEFLYMVCRNYVAEPQDAALTFTKEGFTYTAGRSGTACDLHRLEREAAEALKSGETELKLPVYEVAPAVTEEDLRARTQPLASFSTRYDASNGPRSRNIALAVSLLSGSVLESGAELSFNAAVGKRTRENGFEEAAVIQDGEFVRGVGGGVCQASTTLFGAALRAGLTVTESRPHSLSVGYVPPSQDAMVSEFSDLKLKNPYPYPVYLLGEAREGQVSFTFYGLPDGLRYEVESKVLFRVDPPSVKIVEGRENRVVRQERAGLASESYLVVYEGETVRARTLIRRDTYACVQGIEERVPVPASPETILSEET